MSEPVHDDMRLALGPPQTFGSDVEISEGVEGYYRYHLAPVGGYRSLCGRQVMGAHSSIWWGQPNASHMPATYYCEFCRCKATPR